MLLASALMTFFMPPGWPVKISPSTLIDMPMVSTLPLYFNWAPLYFCSASLPPWAFNASRIIARLSSSWACAGSDDAVQANPAKSREQVRSMAFSRGVDMGSNLQPYSANGGHYWEEKSRARFHSSTTLRNAAICAGLVPQQPPTITTPALNKSGSHAAMLSGVSG